MTQPTKSRGAWHPKRCRRCRRHESEIGRISKAGNCSECAARLMLAQLMEQRLKTGPQHEAWVAGMERARAEGKRFGRPPKVKGGGR